MPVIGSITDTIGRRKNLFPLPGTVAPLGEDSWLRLNRRRNKQPTNVMSSDESLNLVVRRCSPARSLHPALPPCLAVLPQLRRRPASDDPRDADDRSLTSAATTSSLARARASRAKRSANARSHQTPLGGWSAASNFSTNSCSSSSLISLTAKNSRPCAAQRRMLYPCIVSSFAA
jgi:hypothetical protein